MISLRGWRPALRIAWRDARRSRGRSALVLVMITLPVLAVTVAAVVLSTSNVSPREELERRMGAADAVVFVRGGAQPVKQGIDPENGDMVYGGGKRDRDRTVFDIDDASTLLGRPVRAIEFRDGYADVRLGDRSVDVATRQVDLSDPIAAGLFTLREGRLPNSIDEVVVNGDLAERGVAIGDRLDVTSAGTRPTVVGIGDDATLRSQPVAAGPVDSLGEPATADDRPITWLLQAGDVTWLDVQALNAAGAFVVSREVLSNPPSEDQLPAELQGMSGYSDPNSVVVAALVITMALLEVVLLAGPAFAVGARRQSRTLALMAASGGTPSQARRVVLASGLVLGGLAAGIGAVLGIGVAVVVMPLVQRFSSTWFGPIEVPWPVIAGVAGFGLLSALLAAVVPAVLASRQDVVAVLAGRRGDRRPSVRSPLLGALLVGAGIALSVAGSRHGSGGETWIAGAAVLAILGMVLLVPLVVALVARASGLLPLSLRYAARDAARHRSRTVPAVAAVAATVAGVVALGIGASSDARENAETYQPMLPMGDATVQIFTSYSQATGRGTPPTEAQWDAVRSVVGARVDDVEELRGLPSEVDEGSVYTGFRDPAGEEGGYLMSWGGSVDASFLVDDDAVPGMIRLADEAERAVAGRALAAGKVVVLTDHAVSGDQVRIESSIYNPQTGKELDKGRVTWPAVFVEVDGTPPSQAVAPTALAEQLGLEPRTVALYLTQPNLTSAEEQDLDEQVAGVVDAAEVYVESGYQQESADRIVLLVLGALGGLLMLGGTLTATFLALSDARPDLATLSAVGASPRTRRQVAASFALVVGGVGALLGAAVGFVPGLAVVRPLTTNGGAVTCDASGCTSLEDAVGPFYDVPWLLVLAVLVALPLLTSLIVGLSARSRLPLVSRLD